MMNEVQNVKNKIKLASDVFLLNGAVFGFPESEKKKSLKPQKQYKLPPI